MRSLVTRKTSLRKPNRGEIISIKPRPKSVYDFLVSLFYDVFVLSAAVRDIFPTSLAQCSLFVLKVPLNTNKPNLKTELLLLLK